MLWSDRANMASRNVANDRYQNSIDDFLLENGFEFIRRNGKSDRGFEVSQHLKTGNRLCFSRCAHVYRHTHRKLVNMLPMGKCCQITCFLCTVFESHKNCYTKYLTIKSIHQTDCPVSVFMLFSRLFYALD